MKRAAIAYVPFAFLLAACSEPVEMVNVSVEAIDKFAQSAEQMALRDDAQSPLASLVSPDNTANSPLGVAIWMPDPLLLEMGIHNGDIVNRINDLSPYEKFERQWKLTGKPFEEGQINQGPFHSETEKYVQFADHLIAELRQSGRLTMDVYAQYMTRAERDRHGLYSDKPRRIEVTLTP